MLLIRSLVLGLERAGRSSISITVKRTTHPFTPPLLSFIQIVVRSTLRRIGSQSGLNLYWRRSEGFGNLTGKKFLLLHFLHFIKEDLKSRNWTYLIRLLKGLRSTSDYKVRTSIKTIAMENRTILVRYRRSNGGVKINKGNVGQGYRTWQLIFSPSQLWAMNQSESFQGHVVRYRGKEHRWELKTLREWSVWSIGNEVVS